MFGPPPPPFKNESGRGGEGGGGGGYKGEVTFNYIPRSGELII